MPDIIRNILFFFDPEHLGRAFLAGLFIFFIGMALYYVATRTRWASAALKVLGIALALYGAAHELAAIQAWAA